MRKDISHCFLKNNVLERRFKTDVTRGGYSITSIGSQDSEGYLVGYIRMGRKQLAVVWDQKGVEVEIGNPEFDLVPTIEKVKKLWVGQLFE